METTEVVMAGFGGQGMLLAGKILAQASLQLGKAVSWLPSYGPEMRGGTANVIVRISSNPTYRNTNIDRRTDTRVEQVRLEVYLAISNGDYVCRNIG